MPATVNTTGRSQHISPSAPLSAPILALRPTLVPHVYYYCHCDGDKPCPETIVIALIFGNLARCLPLLYYICITTVTAMATISVQKQSSLPSSSGPLARCLPLLFSICITLSSSFSFLLLLLLTGRRRPYIIMFS